MMEDEQKVNVLETRLEVWAKTRAPAFIWNSIIHAVWKFHPACVCAYTGQQNVQMDHAHSNHDSKRSSEFIPPHERHRLNILQQSYIILKTAEEKTREKASMFGRGEKDGKEERAKRQK